MKKNINTILLSLVGIIFLFVNVAFASNRLSSRAEVKQFIHRVANKYKYNPRYIQWVLSKARYNPKVIHKMESPYEAKPWYDYRKLFITQERIDAGVNYWNRSNKLLAWEEREYAIPAKIIVAIIGIESKYGKQMGHYRVLDSLATLAFNYPPRKKFFQKELADFILMTKVYKMHPDAVYGSYAGAMGQSQFMPSSYLYYAVDFHDKGQPNLFKDKADIIFSIGNYLRQNGWVMDQPIALRAQVVGNKYRRLLKTNLRRPIPPRYTLAQLSRYGVHPLGKYINPSLKANLIRLRGENGPEYWLVFHNFFVITTYNANDVYAMAVYQLGNLIQQAWDKKQHKTREKTES